MIFITRASWTSRPYHTRFEKRKYFITISIKYQSKLNNYYCINLILTLSSAGSSTVLAWMVYAMKHRMAPIQRSRAKPPNNCLQNFTHSGVCLGGVRALGPSRSRFSLALACVKPCNKIQEILGTKHDSTWRKFRIEWRREKAFKLS